MPEFHWFWIFVFRLWIFAPVAIGMRLFPVHFEPGKATGNLRYFSQCPIPDGLGRAPVAPLGQFHHVFDFGEPHKESIGPSKTACKFWVVVHHLFALSSYVLDQHSLAVAYSLHHPSGQVLLNFHRQVGAASPVLSRRGWNRRPFWQLWSVVHWLLDGRWSEL